MIMLAGVALLLFGGAGQAQAEKGLDNIHAGYESRAQANCIQRALNLHYGNILDEDGFFGPATERVVKRLQKDAHLDPDGIVGPQTGQLLWNELKAHHQHPECYNVLPTTK